MTQPPVFRVRFAIVGIFAALALAFLVSPGNAQPFRGGTKTYSFSCGGCGADLGTSNSPFGPPGRRVCPRCGAHLVGTKDAPANPGPTGSVGGSSRVLLLIGFAVAGGLLFGALVLVLIVVIVKASTAKPAERSRSARSRRDFE